MDPKVPQRPPEAAPFAPQSVDIKETTASETIDRITAMTVQLRQTAESLALRGSTPVAVATKGGIARGTLILTLRGERRVEALKGGDRIITREHGVSVLRAATRVIGPACTIRTDSLGRGRPDRDTIVSACQHLAVRDWRAEALFGAAAAIVPAHRLADGRHITSLGEEEFIRLDFGTPLTVYANGLEVATGRSESSVVEIADAG